MIAELSSGGLIAVRKPVSVSWWCSSTWPSAEATEWPRIAAMYTALAQIAPSPIVELNRAIAVAMAFGPAAGIELEDEEVRDDAQRADHLQSLPSYQPAAALMPKPRRKSSPPAAASGRRWWRVTKQPRNRARPPAEAAPPPPAAGMIR